MAVAIIHCTFGVFCLAPMDMYLAPMHMSFGPVHICSTLGSHGQDMFISVFIPYTLIWLTALDQS